MVTEKEINEFAKSIQPDVEELVRELSSEIEDDWIDVGDDHPSLQLTIACNDDCTEWTYQTGDNSYCGDCYDQSHWGVTWIYRDSVPREVAESVIDDMLSQIECE